MGAGRIRSDRPRHRHWVRAAFHLLGGARAHHEETWPGLRVARATDAGAGRVLYRGAELCPLLPAKALCARLKRRAVIVGSGPSLREQATERLDPAECLLLNGAISLIDRIGQPAAIVIEDERFVWRHRDMLSSVAGEVLCLLSPAVIRAIASQDRDWLRGREVVLVDDLRKPAHAPRRRLPSDLVMRAAGTGAEAEVALSRAPGEGVVKCGTVAYSALQFALACDLEEIALAGIDLVQTDTPRFYETAKSAAWSGLGKGQARILAHFALARDVAEARGTRLASLSPVSALLKLGYQYRDDLEGAPK